LIIRLSPFAVRFSLPAGGQDLNLKGDKDIKKEEKKKVVKEDDTIKKLVALYDHLNYRVAILEETASDNDRKIDQVAKRLGL